MTPYIAFIQAHWEALSVFGSFFLFAVASTMPKPGTWQGWATLYSWIYSIVQELLSMRSAKMSAGAEPQIKTSVAVSTIPEDKVVAQ